MWQDLWATLVHPFARKAACGYETPEDLRKRLGFFSARGKRATLHAFRHQAITWLTRHSGMADAELQLITGHARRQTLSVYQHVALDGYLERTYQDSMKGVELETRDTNGLGSEWIGLAALGDSSSVLGWGRLLQKVKSTNSRRILWDAGHRKAPYSGYVARVLPLPAPWASAFPTPGLTHTAAADLRSASLADGVGGAEAELRCHDSLRNLYASPAGIDTLLMRSSV